MGRIPRKAEEKWIQLFQGALGRASVRRGHRFDFLRGDPTPNRPKGVPLPVDAYFPDFNLVVEYMGEQHFTDNPLMNRRPGRKGQRHVYQQRRSDVLAGRGIKMALGQMVTEMMRYLGNLVDGVGEFYLRLREGYCRAA